MPLQRGDAPGHLRQHRPQPDVAVGRLPAEALAAALLVAGAHPRPRRQVSPAREAAHVHADLGDDGRRGDRPDAGDCLEQRDRLIIRREGALDLDVHVGDRPLQVVDVR